MGKIEQMLFDLEEYLRRNDDRADSVAYLTIVGIANDVSELEDENAKLREQGARLFDKTLELGTENDKLRELVRDMWHEGAFEPGAYCVPEAYGLAERTRELGIEVDGWLS